MPDCEEFIAYHEAGHAILAMASGFHVAEISAIAGAGGRGYVKWSIPDPADSRTLRLATLAFSAGFAAELLWHTSGRGSYPCGFRDDMRNAEVHLTVLGENGAFLAYALAAQKFLERPEVWGHVEFLAGLLLKADRINGSELIGRIAASCPHVDGVVFQHLEVALEALRQGINRD